MDEQLFANQTAAQAFGRRAGEHCELFGTEWGDGPADVDLRRVGTARRS